MQKINLSQFKIPEPILIKVNALLGRWEFARRYITIAVPIISLAVVASVAVVLSSPLIIKRIQLGSEINNLDLKIKDYKDRLASAQSLDKNDLEKKRNILARKFSPEYSLSFVLNSLTEMGTKLGVKISAISPETFTQVPQSGEFSGYALNVLPIDVSLESEYIKFGQFLDSLNSFPDCLIVVKGFAVSREESILPRLNIKLRLEACVLKKGQIIQQPKEQVHN
ncbi:MAG: hypothetical protein FJZ10_06765 [Candidatus Omnitrophica bacterium]|nr:hypothetical protein [Candidatus Omnitrophota bacterium]